MSRSGYSDDNEGVALWRGQVASALRGKRGQRFIRDLIAGLDALPEKVLIAERLQDAETGCVCALGAVGVRRGIDLAPLEGVAQYGEGWKLGEEFDIARQLALEIQYINDEVGGVAGWHRSSYADGREFTGWGNPETPRERWERVRKWAVSNLEGDL